jgi:hypothetical protein
MNKIDKTKKNTASHKHKNLLDRAIEDLKSNNIESLTLAGFNRQVEDLLLAKMAEKAESDGFLSTEDSEAFLKEIRNT